MTTKNKPYRKLPGRGSFLLTYSRLYRAEDHILQVISTGFTETYLRFYFRDIQLISIRKTHMGKVVNAILGAIMVIFSSLAFAPNGEIAAAIFIGLFGIPLLFNIALGPSCVTYVQTAVQRQKLSSLGRLWAARKTLAILQPLVETAQGPLSPEALQQHFGHGPSTSPNAAPLASSPVRSEDPPFPRPPEKEFPPQANPPE